MQMLKFKDFSMPLSVFQVLLKANFIFKDIQDSPVYSSTFQACANPDNHIVLFLDVDMFSL